MQRLGKNLNRYCGEMIEIRATLGQIEAAAQRHGWASEIFYHRDDLELIALARRSSGNQGDAKRVYLSAGIHGDEPAGPLAVLRLLEENQWPEDVDLWLCPCLNPVGFTLNRRENAQGFDLNRGYLNPTLEEILAHISWLERQPLFDLCLLLHEDWESHGFYLYEQNPDHRPSLAEVMVAQVAKVCPIDPNELIEGRPARNGIIRPNIDLYSRPDWPEAFYVINHKTRLSYTLEAPSDFALALRVQALQVAVATAVQQMVSRRS